MPEKKNIIVFTAKKARELLKKGYTITDIKPDKKDPEGKRSVYVFKNDNGLIESLD